MTELAADAIAAAGKMTQADKDIPIDHRSAEEVDTRNPFNDAKMAQVLADPSSLEGKSEVEIAQLLGMGEIDRSLMVAPDGDATVHELARRAEPKPATPAAPAAAAPGKEQAAPNAAAAPAKADPAADAAAIAAVAAAAGNSADAEPVIESRDGKGRIPYAVLAAERRESARLRAELEQARAGKPAAAGEQSAPATEVAQPALPRIEITEEDLKLYTPEEVESLREKYPAELVDRMVRDNKVAVAGYLRQLETETRSAQNDLRAREMSVQDFIDGHPLASLWAAGATDQDRQLFEAAVVQDRVLRELPEYAEVSWQARMETAIANTAKIYGVDYKASSQRPGQEPTAGQPSLAERAQAALAAADRAPKLPTSHSDLPGGTPAGASESDSIGGMSTSQLEAKLEKLSPKQLEQYLANVA